MALELASTQFRVAERTALWEEPILNDWIGMMFWVYGLPQSAPHRLDLEASHRSNLVCVSYMPTGYVFVA